MLPFLLGILHIIVEMLVMKFRVDVHTTKINKILSSIMIVSPDHPFFLIPISMLKNRLTAEKANDYKLLLQVQMNSLLHDRCFTNANRRSRSGKKKNNTYSYRQELKR